MKEVPNNPDNSTTPTVPTQLFKPGQTDVKSIQELLSRQATGFKAAADQITQAAEALKAHQPIFEALAQRAAAAVKSLSAVKERLKNTNENLSRHGFFLFPYLDDFDVCDVDRLAGLTENELQEFFTSTFRENEYWHLRHIFEKQRGSVYFKERSSLLDQCIIAHTLQMYGLTIPTLMPVIENIILRILKLPVDVGTIRQRLGKNKHREAFCRYLPQVDFFSGILFEQFIFDVFQISTTNKNILLRRNGISHGYETQYATEMSSLFLFFVLNFLFEIKEDQAD